MPAGRPLAPLVVVGGSGSGGSSSFVAANLAVTLAQRDLQVVLVDLDPQEVSDVGRALGLVPERTIYGLAQAGAPYDHDTLERHLITHASGVKVLVGPTDQDDASAIPVDFLREMYGSLRTICDVVLVNVHKLTEGVIATIDLSTCHCMVAMTDSLSLKMTRLCFGTLDLMGYPAERSLLVLHGGLPAGVTHDLLARYFRLDPDVIIPSDRDNRPNYYEELPIAAASERPAVASAFELLADFCMRIGGNEPGGSLLTRNLVEAMSVPIPDSYWVEPGRLLAGEYPGERTDAETALRLQAFLTAGVTSFLDLTDASEAFYESFSSYEGLLDHGIRYLRMPIPDLGCPSEQEMLAILDRIDHELADGRVVYVHCYGGLGRTGTVVGCWLTRKGLTGEQALGRIPILRAAIPDPAWNLSPAMKQLLGDVPDAGRHHLSPQTQQQRDFVRAWPPSDAQAVAGH